MSMDLRPGTVGWIDLTVEDAPRALEFYQAVVGWESSPVPMSEGSGTGYDDWCVLPAGSESPVAGICHARGKNAGLPAAWLVYFVIADLDASIAACLARGGEVVAPPRSMGSARFAVLRDPAGAAFALFQPA